MLGSTVLKNNWGIPPQTPSSFLSRAKERAKFYNNKQRFLALNTLLSRNGMTKEPKNALRAPHWLSIQDFCRGGAIIRGLNGPGKKIGVNLESASESGRIRQSRLRTGELTSLRSRRGLVPLIRGLRIGSVSIISEIFSLHGESAFTEEYENPQR